MEMFLGILRIVIGSVLVLSGIYNIVKNYMREKKNREYDKWLMSQGVEILGGEYGCGE